MKCICKYIIVAWAFLSTSAYSADRLLLEYHNFQTFGKYGLRYFTRSVYTAALNTNSLHLLSRLCRESLPHQLLTVFRNLYRVFFFQLPSNCMGRAETDLAIHLESYNHLGGK